MGENLYAEKSGRIKVSPKPNEDGQFIVSYEGRNTYIDINFRNMPSYILFDIDLGQDWGGTLTIMNANDTSVLSKFKKIIAHTLTIKDSTCTLGSPQEKSYVDILSLRPERGRQLSVELGDLSNIAIETVLVDCESCVDFSPLKNVKEFKELFIKATQNSTYNLNGLKGKSLNISKYDSSTRHTNLTGKFDFDKIDISMYGVVHGLPANVNTFSDTYGLSLCTLKSVQTFISSSWIDDMADQILTKLHNGSLKINKIKQYQAPYEEIPYDEFIYALRMRYVRYAVLGEMNQKKGHWDRITIDPDKFRAWAKTTKYEIVSSGEDFIGKLHMILKDGAPIGAYIEDNGGVRGWSSVPDNTLCTIDKQLMAEIIKL